jgi:hypothetical protein
MVKCARILRPVARLPDNHGGVNWGGTSFNPQLGYLFVNTNELGQLSGQKDHDPKSGRALAKGTGNRVDLDGPYEGVPGRLRSLAAEDVSAFPVTTHHRGYRASNPLGRVDRRQREHGRVCVARAAWRNGQLACR